MLLKFLLSYITTFSIDGSCMIWYPPFGLSWDTITSERQLQRRFLKRHNDDVYDVAWSPDSRRVITGSVDNTCIIWDAARGKDITTLEGHSQFVQGVCWDPAGSYLVSQSNDRSCRIYFENSSIVAAAHKGTKARQRLQLLMSINNRSRRPYRCIQAIKSRTIPDSNNSNHNNTTLSTSTTLTSSTPVPNSSSTNPAELVNKHHIYLDENVSSFFRRPTWTPDGSVLLTPTGSIRENLQSPAKPTTYIFQRGKFTEPLAHLPAASTAKPSIAVRASPILYRLRKNSDGSIINNGVYSLPYRCIFAVATLDAVMIYDTQHPYPIACAANLHPCSITDIAWSSTGSTLFISSIDGYCSLMAFDGTELGEKLPVDDPIYPVFLRERKHERIFLPPPPKKVKAPTTTTPNENNDGNTIVDANTITTPSKRSAVSIEENNNVMDKMLTSTTITNTTTTTSTNGQPAKRKAVLTLIAPLGVDVLPSSIPVLSSSTTTTTTVDTVVEKVKPVPTESNKSVTITTTVPSIIPTAVADSAISSSASGGMSALASVLSMVNNNK